LGPEGDDGGRREYGEDKKARWHAVKVAREEAKMTDSAAAECTDLAFSKLLMAFCNRTQIAEEACVASSARQLTSGEH
jgi:hypothetical protein